MRDINKVGMVSCSNGQLSSYKKDIEKLDTVLRDKGIATAYSDYIYAGESVAAGTAGERARALMEFYADDTIDAIFDISGGDIANEILPYLDYEVIAASNKQFWGYSDLTTVINAIYARTGNKSVLFQVKNLVWDKAGKQREIFLTDEMYKFQYEFVQGKSMQGTVVGGNIRCLLKLSGTPYFPDMDNKILFLESLSGGEAQIRAYFAQLKQLGVFKMVSGVLLGTFTEMEENGIKPETENIAREYIHQSVPIAKTYDIGHNSNSKALVIGQEYSL